jgi:hypothetical protein
MDAFDDTDIWRIIMLYGRNTATYKLALGACLSQFAHQEQTTIRMPDLAAAFFDIYADRLKNGKPQLLHPSRHTVMEQIVSLHTLGKLDLDFIPFIMDRLEPHFITRRPAGWC